MNFYGRKHPIFSTLVEQKIKKITYTPIRHHPIYIEKNELENNSKYFIHADLPIIDPDANIEYIFNFEDQCTLYHSINNGNTFNIDFKNHPETINIKNALEDSRCKKIICHIKKMAEALPNLTNSDIIAKKTVYKKIGINTKNNLLSVDRSNFTILFTNSYHDDPNNFFLRGGHFLLEAVKLLNQKYDNIKLIIRSQIPAQIPGDLLSNYNIKVYNMKMEDEDIDFLYRQSDVVVLPSIRVHSHSLCEALSYGLPVITTNGWGIEEFIQHRYNGYIINGFEKLSWHDNNVGCIEKYINLYDHQTVTDTINQLYYYLEHLLLNKNDLLLLKTNSINSAKTYTLDNWNEWTI
jgi:glycosyltransferase involved in cell wall biosynthesis